MTVFDPNAAALPGSGIFGLSFSEADSALVYLPVPWEVTTSYGGGTSGGPAAILQASRQVDLFDLEVRRPWAAGLHMLPESSEVRAWNDEAKRHAVRIIEAGGVIEGEPSLEASLQHVNQAGERLNAWVQAETRRLLSADKIPAIVGGDHSVPFGAFMAVAEQIPEFGILHFDAHSDTRKAYEGFVWSHASIMYNALEKIPAITRIVQTGIRDFCEEEYEYTHTVQKERVQVYFDAHLAERKMQGIPFARLAEEMIATLPEAVWISFDIDGLDPQFCPHTGTPVPGGLSLAEASWLVTALVRSGRKVIGFDLNEVAPGADGSEWDANVGARLLYRLSALTLLSQGKAQRL